jgi:hypothetical protein
MPSSEKRRRREILGVPTCEKRIAQELSMNVWKSMSPCVVFAWKLGVIEPSRRRGCSSACVAYELRRKSEDWNLETRDERGRCECVRGANERRKLRDAVEAMMQKCERDGRREDEGAEAREEGGKVFCSLFIEQ